MEMTGMKMSEICVWVFGYLEVHREVEIVVADSYVGGGRRRRDEFL